MIVGAGFGGLAAASRLTNRAVDVTLIHRHNYHLFQPLLYQVATAELTASEIAEPIRHILRHAENIDIFMDAVNGIEAKLILARSLGTQIPPVFSYRNYGSMATIGRNKAVVDLRGWRFSGFPGWLLWSVAHIFFLIGFRRRFEVALSWLWNYLTSQRNVRLILGVVTRGR